MSVRAYLDWNAAAPLRPEARAAMLAAMETSGNPSSVHAEGRAVRAVVERARAQVAALAGAAPERIVFTAGASEAAATVIASWAGAVRVSPAAHDCLRVHLDSGHASALPLDSDGRVVLDGFDEQVAEGDLLGASWASGETGVIESDALWQFCLDQKAGLLRDAAQVAGRLPIDTTAPCSATLSSGKLGGPRGVGALILPQDWHPQPLIPGGGQELGRRSGTENVTGIAGFGAAAKAALRELDSGVWSRVEKLRNILEERLEAAAPDTIFVGRGTDRLPNTACFASPGWKAETQVMQFDLAGFAVSAGSACSSGKVRPSRTLKAMGYDDAVATSAIRVSLGPTTTEAEVLAFADTWQALHRRRRERAA